MAPEQSDVLSDRLQQWGALAVTLENAGDDEFYEAAHPQPPTWHRMFATGLFNADVDSAHIVNRVAASVDSAIHHHTETVADRNWERAWVADFHGFEAAPGL